MQSLFTSERSDFALAISREKKQELVADYRERLERSQAVILTSYQGLNVAQISELRNRLRAVGTGYQVIKNTLLRLALQEAKLPRLDTLLEEPTAIGFCYQEVQPAVKVLTEFSRETGTFGLKGGLLGHRLLTTEDINSLASLPSRDTLLAQVLTALQSPVRGLVSVLSGPIRGLVAVLKARADQLASAES
jgi:large subunit ribosomal protein L10